ncbi:MAG: hypothetical protein JW731_10550 [Bacteroidales bacterium]|nr:hypothetical protein [Bacteroidales bacterium]
MKFIKIFGTVNSGTVYLEWLIRKNLDIQILNTYDLGWKHRIAPSKEELTDETIENVIYVCLTKNPYSWILSMHKRPYQHEALKKLGFFDFIKFSYGDYRNPIIMWNQKNNSYVQLADYVKHHILVSYEDVLYDPKKFLDEFADKFHLRKPPFYKNINNLLTNSHGLKQKHFHKDYYLEEKWKSKLNPEHIEYINQFLDKQLMQKLNYSIL